MKLRSVSHWEIDKGVLASPSVTNRNLLARKYETESPDRVLRQYIQMNLAHTRTFYTDLLSRLDPTIFRGTGLELGSGVCAFSAMICELFPGVERIYAVELVPDVVDRLQPVTIPAVSPKRGDRIERVIGSFDKLELPDTSIDFAVEVASLHHSDDIVRTLKEAARTIRPGGHLVAVDRVHPDQLSNAQREFMLDVEYPDAWKRENGYDAAPLTRRENGEHEIRMSEWIAAFESAGFRIVQRLELRELSFAKLYRGAILRLPFPLRRALNLSPSRVRWHDGEWFWTLRALLGITSSDLFVPATRNYSLYVAQRQDQPPRR